MQLTECIIVHMIQVADFSESTKHTHMILEKGKSFLEAGDVFITK